MLLRITRLLLAILMIVAVVGVTGCGQKGDLYLPDGNGSEQRR